MLISLRMSDLLREKSGIQPVAMHYNILKKRAEIWCFYRLSGQPEVEFGMDYGLESSVAKLKGLMAILKN
jgi:hypothetical protein